MLGNSVRLSDIADILDMEMATQKADTELMIGTPIILYGRLMTPSISLQSDEVDTCCGSSK